MSFTPKDLERFLEECGMRWILRAGQGSAGRDAEFGRTVGAADLASSQAGRATALSLPFPSDSISVFHVHSSGPQFSIPRGYSL